MDFTNLPRPSLANSLYAREIPTHGGDTLFTNMYMAYETLSDGMKEMLDGMNAIHGFPETLQTERRPRGSQDRRHQGGCRHHRLPGQL